MRQAPLLGSEDIAMNKAGKVHALKTSRKSSLSSLPEVCPWTLKTCLLLIYICWPSGFKLRIVYKAVFELRLGRCLLKI